MSADALMLLMVAGMHLLGLACAAALLIPALRGPEAPRPHPDEGSDGGWGKQPRVPPRPIKPWGGLPLPLPDAVPARVRLRDHHRLHELLPPRSRRRAREPERAPTHVG
jgi:hypothetical protein